MKTQTIILAREALLPALALVTKAVERRSTIPVLQNLLLAVDAAAGMLTLTGTDLDCELRTSIPCQAGKDDAFTLPATLLHDAVRKMPDGAEITISAEKDFATLTAGRARFKIQVLPAADFPAINTGDFSHTFPLDTGTLQRMLAMVTFAISSEETRYYLNGIHWHAAEDAFNAVATDGHRLAKFCTALPEGAAGMPAIIVPKKTAGLIKQILGDKVVTVTISVSDAKIRIEAGNVTLLSKLIDGTFPDYRRVIPSGNQNRFTVDKDTLAKAVDRVTTVSSERGSAVKFAFEPGGNLVLTTNNPDAGSADDEVTIDDSQGDAVEIGFNGKYCLDLFNAVEGKRLVFSLGDPGSPTLIEPEEADKNGLKPLFVLMPMRVP
ncbi:MULTISPECIES: DNA polymerase III subunit beta [unclassified Mesorhizobium]|uniref:DNA polymerase III subunit beta n=1 Tax=unclassified Mesorhizobium TaxID=325217 RepID=UPI001CD057E9|nr:MULTISPECIES: DNA polymerase III subunit beta [unclassified Mesorhizobium]MCA0027380.1 DNA polymerase III subunit beta [Mesorhizobium sp. B263B1A]